MLSLPERARRLFHLLHAFLRAADSLGDIEHFFANADHDFPEPDDGEPAECEIKRRPEDLALRDQALQRARQKDARLFTQQARRFAAVLEAGRDPQCGLVACRSRRAETGIQLRGLLIHAIERCSDVGDIAFDDDLNVRHSYTRKLVSVFSAVTTITSAAPCFSAWSGEIVY